MDEPSCAQSFFGMENFLDLYAKCHHDLKQLQNSDPRKKSYAIFNLVMDLNHLFDWFMKDQLLSDELKVRCVQKFNPYKEKASDDFVRWYKGIPFPLTNEGQYLVRCVSNKAKHSKTSPTTEAALTTVGLGAGSEYAEAGAPWNECGASELQIVTYWVEDDGLLYDMKVVCSDLQQEWSDFIRQNGLLPSPRQAALFQENDPWPES